VTEPRRVLIDWEYLCDSIYWVPDKVEWEATDVERRQLEKVQRQGGPPVIREWRERLSEQVLRELKAWNDSWDPHGPPDLETAQLLRERGRELAVRVQDELGDRWLRSALQAGRVGAPGTSAGQLARRHLGAGPPWLPAAGPAPLAHLIGQHLRPPLCLATWVMAVHDDRQIPTPRPPLLATQVARGLAFWAPAPGLRTAIVPPNSHQQPTIATGSNLRT
jgi:hypothetical protein